VERHFGGLDKVQTAVRHDEDLKRFYKRLAERRGRPKAKVAAARNLLIRAYIMQSEVSKPMPG
jgi:hypothetical protein